MLTIPPFTHPFWHIFYSSINLSIKALFFCNCLANMPWFIYSFLITCSLFLHPTNVIYQLVFYFSTHLHHSWPCYLYLKSLNYFFFFFTVSSLTIYHSAYYSTTQPLPFTSLLTISLHNLHHEQACFGYILYNSVPSLDHFLCNSPDLNLFTILNTNVKKHAVYMVCVKEENQWEINMKGRE